MNRYSIFVIMFSFLILISITSNIGQQLTAIRNSQAGSLISYENNYHGVSIDVPGGWNVNATRRRSVSRNGAMLAAYSISLFSSHNIFNNDSNKSERLFWMLRLNEDRLPFGALVPPYDSSEALMAFIFESLEGYSGTQVKMVNVGQSEHVARYQTFISRLHNERIELYVIPRPNEDYYVLMLWSPLNIALEDSVELGAQFVETVRFLE